VSSVKKEKRKFEGVKLEDPIAKETILTEEQEEEDPYLRFYSHEDAKR